MSDHRPDFDTTLEEIIPELEQAAPVCPSSQAALEDPFNDHQVW